MSGIVQAQPQQARSEATLERIIAAGERLFAIRRTTAVPVRELCDEAGVSRSSFYARFEDERGPARVAYERFCQRVLARTRWIDERWASQRPGGDDFEAFVSFVVESMAELWEPEVRLVQAFRAGEVNDPWLRTEREWLDGEIVRSIVRATCHHYAFDADTLLASLGQGMGVLAAAFRGALDFPDQLEVASPDARAKIHRELAQLTLRFTPAATPQNP